MHFLVPKNGVSMLLENSKTKQHGAVPIHMLPTSPGADLELNWLRTSAAIPALSPRLRLYWPLPEVLVAKCNPQAAAEVRKTERVATFSQPWARSRSSLS